MDDVIQCLVFLFMVIQIVLIVKVHHEIRELSKRPAETIISKEIVDLSDKLFEPEAELTANDIVEPWGESDLLDRELI